MEEYCFGTGGLVRAYSSALTEAINNATITQKDLGYMVDLNVNYNDVEKLKYFLSQKNITIVDTNFDENVTFKLEMTKEEYNEILNKKEEFNFKIIDIKITKEGYINY